ncbi:hypothetical protein D3C72_1600370 [compost metagenome]
MKNYLFPAHSLANTICISDIADHEVDIFVIGVRQPHIMLFFFISAENEDRRWIEFNQFAEDLMAETAGAARNQYLFSANCGLDFLFV